MGVMPDPTRLSPRRMADVAAHLNDHVLPCEADRLIIEEGPSYRESGRCRGGRAEYLRYRATGPGGTAVRRPTHVDCLLHGSWRDSPEV